MFFRLTWNFALIGQLNLTQCYKTTLDNLRKFLERINCAFFLIHLWRLWLLRRCLSCVLFQPFIQISCGLPLQCGDPQHRALLRHCGDRLIRLAGVCQVGWFFGLVALDEGA
jgi:hypothetical protein